MTATLQSAMSTTDSAGDLFLSGSYIELGISSYGNFGTEQGLTPAGYAQAGSQGVGLAYNQAGFGVDPSIPTIDVVTPGGPLEAMSAGYTQNGATETGYNYKDGRSEGITATSLTNTSSGSTLSAEWVGVLDGALKITVDYSFGAADQYFTTTVTLTNVSGSAMTDARYDRTVDPDNTAWYDDENGGDGYTTVNTVVSQQSSGGASEITATSQAGDSYEVETGSTATLLYYSDDAGTSVGVGSGLNPFSATADAAGYTETEDDLIHLSYDAGALAAGASASFSYITGMTSDATSVVSSVTVTPLAISGLDAGSVAGSTAADVAGTATADPSPTIDGTGVAGDTVTVLDGTAVLGTALVASDGTWQFATTSLADGTHVLGATDATSGQTAAPYTLDIDAAPAIAGADTAGNHVGTDGEPSITGTAAALTPIGSTITIYADGVAIGTTATTDAAGDWSYTPTTALGVGTHVLAATETVDGVVSNLSDPYDYTQMPTAPTALTLQGPGPAASSGLTDGASPTITGLGTAGDTVTLFDGTTAVGMAVVAADGTWTINPAQLEDGSHDLTATQTSSGGLVSAASDVLAVTIDTVAPTLGVTLADDTGISSTDALTSDASLRGIAEAGTVVTLSEDGTVLATTLATTDGSWSVAGSTLALADGSHAVTVTDTDAAGNSSNVTLDFTLDTTPPAVSMAAASLLADTPTPLLSGTAEDGASVAVLLDGQLLGTTTASATTGAWSYQVTTPIADGAHTVAAQATDAAGNVSAVTAASTLLVVPTPTASGGVSTADLASLSFSQLVGQDYSTQFVAGTEAVQLSDGTLSVGADTQQAYIARLYEAVLGRPEDTPGITGWNASADAGASNTDLAAGFLGSQEGQAAVGSITDAQFVDTLYQNALGRTATTAETDYWTGALSGGDSRATVLADIADSPEAKQVLAGATSSVWVPDADAQLVVFTYEAAFDRAPEAAGLQFWTAALKDGMSTADLMNGFVDSPEFQAAYAGTSADGLVTSLYENALGRAPSAAELGTYAGGLQNGSVTAADLLAMVATSKEAYAHLATTL